MDVPDLPFDDCCCPPLLVPVSVLVGWLVTCVLPVPVVYVAVAGPVFQLDRVVVLSVAGIVLN